MDDVIVIGSVIVGVSATCHLARAGAQITLLGRVHPGPAPAAEAGIIAPGITLHESAAYYALALSFE